MALTFVEDVPAQVKTTKGRSARIVAQLQENPGKWAIAYRMASRSLATSRASALRSLGAEVTTRTESGRIFVYARITSPQKASEKAPRKSRAQGVKRTRKNKLNLGTTLTVVDR